MPVSTEIIDVEAPSEASAGERVTIRVWWHNYGDPGPAYIRVEDAETGKLLGGGGYGTLTTCMTVSGDVGFPMPNRDLTVRITTGEGTATSPVTKTDSRTVTIRLRAAPPPGPPKFVIDDVSPTRVEIPPNTVFEISVRVRNVGESAGPYGVVVKDERGYVRGSTAVVTDVPPGGYHTATVSVNGPSSPGTFTWRVEVVNGVTNELDDYTYITVVTQALPKFYIVSVEAPDRVYAGEKFSVTVRVKNTGAARGTARVWIGYVTYKDVEVDPDSTVPVTIELTASTTPGTYNYVARVVNLATSEEDDSKSFSVVVEEVVLSGRILVTWYWIEGMENWEHIAEYPHKAKVGDTIYIAVPWANESEVPVTGHVDAVLTSPSGKTYTLRATQGQDTTTVPGRGAIVQFEPTTLNEAGTWGLHVRLALDGKAIDEKTYTFEVVVEKTVEAEATVTVTSGTPPIDVEVSISVDGDVQKCVETVGSVPSTVVCRKSWRVPAGSWTVRAEAVLSNQFGTTKLGPVSRSVTVT